MTREKHCLAGRRAFVALVLAGAACGSSQDGLADVPVAGARAAVQVPVEPMDLSFATPAGADFRSVALAASQVLRLETGVAVVDQEGAGARVTNSGAWPAQDDFGVDSRVGDIVSVARVQLHERARVAGDVQSGADVTLWPGATVGGAITRHAPKLTPLRTVTWKVDFQRGSNDAIAYPGQSVTVAPGAYRGVYAYPGATLALASGTYYFDRLDLEQGSTLALDGRNGPVVIFLRTSLVYRGETRERGPGDRLLIGLAGSAPATIESDFHGVLVAPRATVRIGIVGKHDSGAIFTRDLWVDPGVRFELRPFEFWNQVLGPSAPGPQDCALAVPIRKDLQGRAREVAYQRDIARYCSMPGVDACTIKIAARVNVDVASAAFSLFAQASTPAQYLAIVRDRLRKQDAGEDDVALARKMCGGAADVDDDLVPDPQDSCRNTPPMTPTLPNGCTDPTLPDAPSAVDVNKLLGSGKILFDPRCSGASIMPRAVAGAFYRPVELDKGTYLVAGRVLNQPEGCLVWYLADIEEYNPSGVIRRYQVTFAESEAFPRLVGLDRAVPDGFIQFNPLPVDAGTRGLLGKVGGKVGVRFRLRTMNGAGMRSDWSDWKVTTLADCRHLGFTCGQ